MWCLSDFYRPNICRCTPYHKGGNKFPRVWPKCCFPVALNFYERTCVKFTFANKIEVMHERLLVRVKVKPRLTSRLISALFILPLFYLRDLNLRALTSVTKNAASVEINLNQHRRNSDPTRRNEEIDNNSPCSRQYMCPSRKNRTFHNLRKKCTEQKDSVTSPWRRIGLRRLSTWLNSIVCSKTVTVADAPVWASFPTSSTVCGCKGSTACWNATDETVTGRAEQSLPDPRSVTLFTNWQLCIYHSDLRNA